MNVLLSLGRSGKVLLAATLALGLAAGALGADKAAKPALSVATTTVNMAMATIHGCVKRPTSATGSHMAVP
jgi:hypothetical protein